MPLHAKTADALADDHELVRRIARHDASAFEVLMRRHNGTLFRVARSILGNDADAEDALQEAYIAAYLHVATFRGEAKVLTWLTRIVVNQALARQRSRVRDRRVVPFAEPREVPRAESLEAVPDPAETPESETIRGDIRRLLERKIDALPVAFRTVFMLREVSDLSAEETAACLSIPEATVRTRLFRARGLLREALARELDLATGDVFEFGGERCNRVVAHVLTRCRHLGLVPQPV
jgi:RNA polymerase sigma-70 factor (ECF subfamily)